MAAALLRAANLPQKLITKTKQKQPPKKTKNKQTKQTNTPKQNITKPLQKKLAPLVQAYIVIAMEGYNI